LKTQTKLKPLFNLKTFSFKNAKKTDFNVIKFLVIYIVLLQSFYLYVGITSEGGKLFSPFLSKYLNFPGWLTYVIAGLSKFFLSVAGYTIYQQNAANITITGSRGVTIAWACLGAGAMSLWIAFIAAHRGSFKYKTVWIFGGLVLICLVNAARVAMIALSNYHHWLYLQHFNAHTSFNIVTYAVILLFMYVFARSYNKTKQHIASVPS
jgi:exosortase/archaeosortase family protein